MTPFRPKILLYRGAGLISAAVRWQTDSDEAHAALLISETEVLEAMQFAGVRIRKADDLDQADILDVPSFSDAQWALAIAFAREQVGKGYDYCAILRFITRRKPITCDRWFCSELVFAALHAGGLLLLRGIEAVEVSPGRLNNSPLLLADRLGMPRRLKPMGDRRAWYWRLDHWQKFQNSSCAE